MKITIEDNESKLNYKYSIEVPHLDVDELLVTMVNLFTLYGYQIESLEEAISEYQYRALHIDNEENNIYYEKGSAEWAWQMWCIDEENVEIVQKNPPINLLVFNDKPIMRFRGLDKDYWAKHRDEFIQYAKQYTWKLTSE